MKQDYSKHLVNASELEVEAAIRLAEFDSLEKTGSLDSQTIRNLASSASSQVIKYFDQTGKTLRDAVSLICKITTHTDERISRIGVEALFPELVERLNDSFEPSYCRLYDSLFSQVIDFYRKLPVGRILDETLNRFRLPDEASLLARKNRILQGPKRLSPSSKIKKAIVLSRVTIGADVAITSVVMSRLKQVFPEAEIVLVGSEKLYQLFGGDDRIRISPINYSRNSNVLSRLYSWPEIVESINSEIVGLCLDEYLLFDPDSRLTQLGLLPLLTPQVELDHYYFFESRSYKPSSDESIGQLSSLWLNELLLSSEITRPFINLPGQYFCIGKEVTDWLRRFSPNQLVTVSFGAGDNLQKCFSPDFEFQLVLHLCKANNSVILDSGISLSERLRSQQIIDKAKLAGLSTLILSEFSYQTPILRNLPSAQILVWEGGIGSFASLIANSDKYIGYDSSGQHIAAALSIPTLTFFTNQFDPKFLQRWQPTGSSRINSLVYDSSQPHLFSEVEKFLQFSF